MYNEINHKYIKLIKWLIAIIIFVAIILFIIFYLIFFYEDSKLDNNVYDNQNNLIYDNETR